jgi:hypothetical protein
MSTPVQVNISVSLSCQQIKDILIDYVRKELGGDYLTKKCDISISAHQPYGGPDTCDATINFK